MRKKLIFWGQLVLGGQAVAVTVTLPLSDEIDSSDGKICIYPNSQRTEEAEVPKGYPCLSVKTIDTETNEKYN
ncbi:hypothetical protein ACXG8N_001799 [Klebsiella aerogenes]|uniref:hypothetical protein n=1 Tax=Klebsiella aerogenes TaxID=548 RepID=UPI000750251F|nr:hypothetical protein [Klebsiella aerogenes]ELA1893588.1 hypothetical protein [Klebsiella aerogenes]KUQ12062.1 hypothetical protein AWI08_08350 [Klebsiella aerogenes]MCB4371578.1 hypothetical protein [Klebsiella aerogenes]MDX6891021.1 hypothetical protein [Klebsiella aerogenes]MEA8784222.1 hypothetical protein [Klebsiella aerogenes]